MNRQVKCECGYLARGTSDAEVIAEVRTHLQTDHPELNDKVTDDQIQGWIETTN
jgi:predicted small metal-binding protein